MGDSQRVRVLNPHYLSHLTNQRWLSQGGEFGGVYLDRVRSVDTCTVASLIMCIERAGHAASNNICIIMMNPSTNTLEIHN